MKPYFYTVLVSLLILTVSAKEGIYETATKGKGTEHKLTRNPEKSASVWLGKASKFHTDNVILTKQLGENRVVWVGRFLGDRPNRWLIKLDDEIFSVAGILGPAQLNNMGAVSSHGIKDRYRISITVSDKNEATKLMQLLKKQGL